MTRESASSLLLVAGVVLLAAVAMLVAVNSQVEDARTIGQGASSPEPTVAPSGSALDDPLAPHRSVANPTASASDDGGANLNGTFKIHIIDSVTRQGVSSAHLRLEQGDLVAEYPSPEGLSLVVDCVGDGVDGAAPGAVLHSNALDCREMETVTGMASAPGYAPRVFDFRTMSMGRSEFDVELLAAGSIAIVALDSTDQPIEGVKVVIDTGGSDFLPSEGGQTSLQGRRLEFGPDAASGRVRATGLLGGNQYTGITDGDGSVVMGDLPVNSELSLRLVDSGRVHALGTVVLLPGQLELRTWVRPPGFGIRGRIGGQGIPIPKDGISICLTRAAGSERDKHLLRGDEDIFATVRSAGDGWFEFEEIPAGTWLIAPIFVLNGPVQHRTQQHHGCLARVISLPAMQDATVELEILPPLYLLGSARPDSGRLGRQARVSAHYLDHSGYVTTKSTMDGYYSLGPLAPGLYRVEIESFGGEMHSIEWIVDWPSPSVLDLIAPTK